MYRATKIIDGKQFAFLDADRAKVEAWLKEGSNDNSKA
jgi:hypothetical protein